MSKPRVHYTECDYPPVVGESAHVFQVDHPRPFLGPAWVWTTEVLSISGPIFETRNSIYAPLPPTKEEAEKFLTKEPLEV